MAEEKPKEPKKTSPSHPSPKHQPQPAPSQSQPQTSPETPPQKTQVHQGKLWAGIIIGAIALILLIAIGIQRQKETQGTAIRIGVMIPLTGDAASYGLSVKDGIELAKKDLGSNLELIYEDSKCDGKEAVTAINKLISINKVQAIIGELCSGATLPAAPIANEQKVVMISPASTSPKITEAGDFIFRTVPSDALQGDFGAALVAKKGFKKLAILYSNEEYGVGFNEVLVKSFVLKGGLVVASEAFERTSVDLRTQLTKIKNAKPDSIYIISNSPDSAVAALKQIKELKINATIFGSEGLKSDDIIKGAGNSAEGLILTSVSSGTTGFIQRHNEVYTKDPGPFAAQGYDAFQALHLAIQAGAKTGEEIKNKIYATEFDGASGKIKFDENGEITGNYDIYIVKDGKFELSQ